MAQAERVDVLVLGSGEAGKYLAWHMAHAGHRTAAVGSRCASPHCR
jgi:pyruvate/2-oxoglutarate dehydrogenase complex dihydrolipoamide dehydrogenase (E3) component